MKWLTNIIGMCIALAYRMILYIAVAIEEVRYRNQERKINDDTNLFI